jgi:hypothetical protein
MTDYDDDDDDDWVEIDDPVEDDCFSDDPDLDVVDSFEYMEEHTKADTYRSRRLKRKEIERTFRVSKDDPPPSHTEKPLTERKESIMSTLPQIPGYSQPWPAQDGRWYYTDLQTNKHIEAFEFLRALEEQQRRQQGGYSPYPQPMPQYAPPQPSQYNPRGAAPMAMPPNTGIYGQPTPQPMGGQPAPVQTDYERALPAKQGKVPQVNDQWSNAPLVTAGAPNPAVVQPHVPVQEENELRVTTETVLYATSLRGQTGKVAYNRKRHFMAPLADSEGVLYNYIIPIGAQDMNKRDHLVEKSAYLSEAELADEGTVLLTPEERDLSFVTVDEMQASSMDRVIAVTQHACVKGAFKPTVQPFEVTSVLGALCSIEKSDQITKVTELLATLSEAGEDEFTDWVGTFKALRGVLKSRDLDGIARTLNQLATSVATDVLKYGLDIDIDLTNGFEGDIDELISHLNSTGDLDNFITLFMKAYRQDVGLDVGELSIGGDDCDALIRVTKSEVLAVNEDIFNVNGMDTGIDVTTGRVTETLMSSLHGVVTQYFTYKRKGEFYFYVTNVEGGWVKCARSCGKVGELDRFYIVDSGN